MSDEMLIRHCAPTLAGLKTGNMFTCNFDCPGEMRRTLTRYNKRLSRKGLRVIPLRYSEGRALIYVYRPAKLREDLCHGTAERLLREGDTVTAPRRGASAI